MPPVADVRQRLVVAAYACVARHGMGKTTVEDIGREAGVSRATVYRYFPGGRDELLQAAVAHGVAEFAVRLYEQIQDAPSLEQVMERGILFAHRAIVEHEVLQRIMETEPELLLPQLTVEGNQVRAAVAAFLLQYLRAHGVASGVDDAEAADFLARMIMSYMTSPGRWDLDDPAQVSELVRAELLAGIVVGPEPSAPGPPGG